eukprot:CAMPEP_0173430682 /NCGR_PEP_ID=MMETSP1357-20121228/9044_1 /TAXON_ID=77926 /ORGANISM="Hemiselmis rufescens, Strain PCC563" /LENGTH=81 /DNA_ID=CAMNT_0014395059 /DNA_START=1 /DNA_END=246 /DNA_ORIENTATION=-
MGCYVEKVDEEEIRTLRALADLDHPSLEACGVSTVASRRRIQKISSSLCVVLDFLMSPAPPQSASRGGSGDGVARLEAGSS